MGGLIVNPKEKRKDSVGMSGTELGTLLAQAVANVNNGDMKKILPTWQAVGITIVDYIKQHAIVKEDSVFKGFATPGNANYESQLRPAQTPYNAISARQVPSGEPDAPLPTGDYYKVSVQQTVTGRIE